MKTQDVDINIQKSQQLFNSADVAPFQRQALNDDFVEYLESCANGISHKTLMRFRIYVSTPDQEMTSLDIENLIKAHFHHKIQVERRRLSKHWKTSRFFLLVGLAILTVCSILAHFAQKTTPPLLGATAREGLLILGWVSMWKPLEAIYDWYPFYDRIRQYKRIEASEIDVRFG